jgi:hypothetical protein
MAWQVGATWQAEMLRWRANMRWQNGSLFLSLRQQQLNALTISVV